MSPTSSPDTVTVRRAGPRQLTGLTVVLLALTAATPLAGQRLGNAERDEWQRVPDVFAALAVAPGSRIADVGAGGGYFTDRLSLAVGPEGRVFAVDIDERTIMRLRDWVEREGRGNVEVILGETDDPRLPYGSLDGALIVNAYHEMTEFEAMLEGIRRALRPGGRLVIVDNPPRDDSAPRAEQTERHDIAIDLVTADLERAGFRVIVRQPAFIDMAHDGHTHRHWLLAAEPAPVTVPPPAGMALDPSADAEAVSFWCAFSGLRDQLLQRRSPPDSVEAAVGGGRLKVCYSRPAARGRTIMGELVPFGEPWRTGANEATLIHVGFDAAIGALRLEPGTYSLYTIPGTEEWEVVVNRQANRDGMPLDEGVRALDLGRVRLPVERLDQHVESLTFEIQPTGPGSAELVLEWETTRVRIPVRRVGGG